MAGCVHGNANPSVCRFCYQDDLRMVGYSRIAGQEGRPFLPWSANEPYMVNVARDEWEKGRSIYLGLNKMDDDQFGR